MSQYAFEKFFILSPDPLCITAADGSFKREDASFKHTPGEDPCPTWGFENILAGLGIPRTEFAKEAALVFS